MATRSDVSQEKAVKSPSTHNYRTWSLALAGILTLALIGLTIIFQAPGAVAGPSGSRALDAWAARYQGLADSQALQADTRIRANSAYADRLQGMAEAYMLRIQRAHAAYTARMQGLASYEDARITRANTAYTQRMQGLANAIMLKEATRAKRANDAYSARLQGLADWYAQEK